MTPERLIRFQCARPDHHASPPAGPIGIVTLHDGKWAYCHSAAKDRHEWSEIEGTMLELLNAIGRSHGEMCWQWEELSAAQRRIMDGRRHSVMFTLFGGSGGLGFAVP